MTTGARAMTPADITRIRWVSDPRISPDGRRVAFVVTVLSEERDEYLSNIWVVDTAGGEPRRFTTGPGRDTAPRWSPDGAWLAFLSEREAKAKPQLHVMPADGGEPVRLTDLPHGASAPAWAPDCARLAFVSRVGPAPGEGPEKSKPARVISTVKYRFDGEGFIYDRRPHVFVVAREGGTPKQTTEGDYAHGAPAWSPDGRLIAFTAARHEARDDDDAADVWVVEADGGQPRRLTSTSGPVSGPAFAPDGRMVAYVARPAINAFARNLQLFAMSPEGGTARSLSAGLDRSIVALGDTWASWSPDGQWILFAVEDGGRVVVHRVPAEGSAPRCPYWMASGW